MEALRAELARRRAETEKLKERAGGAVVVKRGKKFVSRGALEAARKAEYEAQYKAEQAKKRAALLAKLGLDTDGSGGKKKGGRKRPRDDASGGAGGDGASTPSAGAGAGTGAGSGDVPESPAVKLPVDTVKQRLRSLGHPITLFGESDSQRLARMRKVESTQGDRAGDEDMRLGQGHEMSNVFLQQDQKKGTSLAYSEDAERARKKAKKSHKKRERSERSALEKAKRDDYMYCRYFFKKILRMWEDDLAKRPDAERRTAQGKHLTATHKQCKDYMRPFFKMCKTKELPKDILKHVRKIVSFCEEGEYVKANSEYVLVSIGNAAWPMGVTSIGIHERAARTKIFTDKVAHVMNDERQRKYITSIKRLMTYHQKKFPTVPSKMVM